MVPTGCHVGGYDHLREVGDLIGPVADSADVHVCDGIAVGHPELGVGSFEFRQVGNGPFGDARGVGLELVGTVLVGALAVVRPGEDDGNLGRRVGGRKMSAYRMTPSRMGTATSWSQIIPGAAS